MRKISVNGVQLNVIEIRQRAPRRPIDDRQHPTPIIFIHGLAASSAFWYGAGVNFISLLGPCYLYDLRGHGKSETPQFGYRIEDMADDLVALMDESGIEKAHIIGHSFGGMIALKFAVSNPERVESLVLADVRLRQVQSKLNVTSHDVSSDVKERLRELGIDVQANLRNDGGVGYLQNIARIEAQAGEDAEALIQALYRHSRVFRSRRSALRWLSLTENTDLIENLDLSRAFEVSDLKRLSFPMLILVGSDSPVLPSARSLARLCPHAIYREIPQVGHFFPISHPRRFLIPTMRFLRAVIRRDPRLEAVSNFS
jgi:pimeloyl-ACP methyl ester carboxylesterase